MSVKLSRPARYIEIPSTESTHMGRSSGSVSGNPGSGIDMSVGSWWRNSGDNFARAGLMRFDTTPLAGATIRRALLDVTVTAWSNIFEAANGSGYLKLMVVECLRAFVESQVTYSVFSTGNSWTTAGGLGAGTDRSTEFAFGDVLIFVPPASSSTNPAVVTVDVTLLLKLSLAAGRTTFRTIMGMSGQTSSQNSMTVAGIAHATAAFRPFLRVQYV